MTSQQALGALFSQETPEEILTLLTITHESLPAPLRLVNYPKPVTSRGHVFEAFPFELTLPDDADRAQASAEIRIGIVEPRLKDVFRGITPDNPPRVLLEIVLASMPDDVVRAFDGMVFVSATWDDQVLTATLGAQGVNKAYPKDLFAPSTTPGVF